MIINKKILRAEFINRPNRFQAFVKIDGKIIIVHVPNTGRCKEILLPNSTVILREEMGEQRKTKYDLIGGYKDGRLIIIDSQIPNRVVEEALIMKKISSLKLYNNIQREKTFLNSRFDFKLVDNYNSGCEYFLEVKGVTYEDEGVVKFPDAPTERGRKHLSELMEAKKIGKGAGVLFLIQMQGVKYFTPFDFIDPKFGDILREAYDNGIDVMAYDCIVTENSITLNERVEVRL